MRTLTICIVALCAGLAPSAEPVLRVAQRDETSLAGDGAQNELSISVEKLGNPLAKRYPDGSGSPERGMMV
jgi:hypothetical protein